ncbi:MAG: S8 family peptidase [Methylomonas sp.]
MAGLEPETVLVVEIAGRVDDFKQAVEAAGLEWLGEWDLDDIEPDDDFYEVNNREERSDKNVSGRLFLSLVNERALQEILSLWEKWRNQAALPSGMKKWREVFSQIVLIRRWGIEETLGETGMLELWREIIDPFNPNQEIYFQIELFYRSNLEKRRQNENVVAALLQNLAGQTISPFIDNPDIAFHAVKAKLPAGKIILLLDEISNSNKEIDIHIPLFKFPNIMYFRPTGQSLATMQEDEGHDSTFPIGAPDLPPVAAILDGVPNLQHEALKDRLLLDDPENLAENYQPGERRHGTSIASLVVHGDLDDENIKPLARQVYHRPIMQPNPQSLDRDEHVPEKIFLEDRIFMAIKRMLEGEGDVPAQAPHVKIVNLSIGDPFRPFIHTPSPLARLLDWLAWKYRILFCVSAGNFGGDIDLQVSALEFSKFSDEEKIYHTIQCIEQQLSERRLLSPAEAMNVLTVGALHDDKSGDYPAYYRIDLLPDINLFSPASRFGHGFRKSIKPEILLAGGRQLYRTPSSTKGSLCGIDKTKQSPGQKVAWDSKQEGELSQCVHTRGTSNATALATRSGVLIYDVLQTLQIEHGEQIRDELISVVIKTLLVHGARHNEQVKSSLTAALKKPDNSRKIKEVLARYLGYGAVDIERVMRCTEQRGTILGCGEIKANDVHEYRLPLPPALTNRKDWRRLVVTLAWFTPINPNHRNLREAKLELSSPEKWDAIPLKLARQDVDHNQVHRGTVQHEVLEGEKQISAYQDGEHILIHVTCKADATASLDDLIPYGLAVTLEVKEGVNIPIYQELRARIKPQVAVGAS